MLFGSHQDRQSLPPVSTVSYRFYPTIFGRVLGPFFFFFFLLMLEKPYSAVIETNPDVFTIADELDQERAQGKVI